jgi:hypothetical protein
LGKLVSPKIFVGQFNHQKYIGTRCKPNSLSMSARALQREHIIPLKEGSRGECIDWTGKKSTDLGMTIAAATCKGGCDARVGGNGRDLRC